MRRAACALVVGLGMVLVGAARASADRATPRVASQDEGDVSIEVAAGFEKWIAPDRSYPISVTVEAERLVRGAIKVSVVTTHGTASLQRVVEVGGGNTERFDFVGPPGQETGFLEIRALLIEDGDVVARAEGAMQIDPDVETVGMLPDVATRNGSQDVMLAIENAGSAQLVDVAPEILDLGPFALEPLDQLVVYPAELAALPDDWRSAVTTWVDRGGQLLVVGDPAALEGVLPDQWLPAAGQAARAGLGRVRSVGEDWSSGLLPSPTRSIHEEETIASDLFSGHNVAAPLSQQARAKLPAAGGLGLLLAGYVLLIGPAVFFMARSLRRRQLAWVAVPVLALASTGVAFAGGSSLRTPAGSAQVTVYETGPAGTVATTWSLLTHPQGGEVGIQLPARWNAGPVPNDLAAGFVGAQDQPPVTRVEYRADHTEAVVDAPTATYGLVAARGPMPSMGEALVVTAQSEANGRVVGTVRNQLDVPLEHALALVNRTGVADLGTVAAGEEKSFEIEGATNFAWGSPHPEESVWPADWGSQFMDDGGNPIRAVGPDGGFVVVGVDGDMKAADGNDDDGDNEGPVVQAAWAETLRQTGWNYRPPGQVLAVGWTDALDSPVELRRGTASLTRSNAAVVARSTITPAGDRLTDATVVRSFVRGPLVESTRIPGVVDDSRSPDGNTAVEGPTPGADIPPEVKPGAGGGVIRVPPAPPRGGGAPDGGNHFGVLYGFDLPSSVGGRPVDTSRLVLGLPAWYEAAQIWVPGGWQPLTVPRDADAEIATSIPADAVVGGMVFVRAALPIGPPETAPGFVLYEQEAQG